MPKSKKWLWPSNEDKQREYILLREPALVDGAGQKLVEALYDGARINPLTGDFDGAADVIGCSPEEGVPACVTILAAGSCPQSRKYS